MGRNMAKGKASRSLPHIKPPSPSQPAQSLTNHPHFISHTTKGITRSSTHKLHLTAEASHSKHQFSQSKANQHTTHPTAIQRQAHHPPLSQPKTTHREQPEDRNEGVGEDNGSGNGVNDSFEPAKVTRNHTKPIRQQGPEGNNESIIATRPASPTRH